MTTLIVTVLFVAAGMAPTIVSFYIVPSATNRVPFTVMLFNIAGLIPVLGLILADTSGRGDVVTNIFAWFVIYMSAAIGMALIWAAPHMVVVFQSIFAGPRRAKMRSRQQELFKEWGSAVVDD